MKKYYVIAKGVFHSAIVYRAGFMLYGLGNMLYIICTYFLWKAIFGSKTIINGMTFNQTFFYLVMTSSLYFVLNTHVDADFGRSVRSGNIIMNMLKPASISSLMFAQSIGITLSYCFIVTLPSILLAWCIFGVRIPLGTNILFFIISIILSYLISFYIDFFVGSISFYTQSMWGVSNTKFGIIAILSGALVPLNFFPVGMQHILKFLPFQAMYNVPVDMIIFHDKTAASNINNIIQQIFWVIILFIISKLFFMKSVRVLTINGG